MKDLRDLKDLTIHDLRGQRVYRLQAALRLADIVRGVVQRILDLREREREREKGRERERRKERERKRETERERAREREREEERERERERTLSAKQQAHVQSD